MKKAGILAAILALASPPLVLAQIGYSQRAKEIGTNLKCMCRGCDMSAELCAQPGGIVFRAVRHGEGRVERSG